MKAFKINVGNGKTSDAAQLATFTRPLDGHLFRFVVTQMPMEKPAVTHRLSGRRVCWISHTEQAACLGNIKRAANMALDHLVKQFSEARLRSVLEAAET